ncbi:MAG: TolC family protein [Ignavibacteriaceae bacterium]|jgi:outer membrane protein TolC|nr:TolC family protein [Ignavibacteriaceae bacterium]MCW8994794.1 TolC family protein [Psychromonas sp.]MCW9098451.1 TolC family protein [Ignavibacteriaceae bacterium]
MKKTIIISLLLSAILYPQNKKLTLEECLQTGLQNSRELKISESVLRSSDKKVTEFTSQMLPKLSLSAGYTYMNLNNPSELGIGPAPIKIINPFYTYGMQLSIQQPIFTGFQLSSSRSAAKNTYEAISFEHQKNINNKALEIYSAYWNLFKAKKQYKLMKEYLASLNDNLKQTKDFLDNGLATMNDYLKIKVQVSNTEVSLIDAKNNFEIARASLNKALGIPLDEPTEIETSFTAVQDEMLNYQDLLSSAMNNREELKSLDYKVKAGEDKVTAANSGWWPKIYASGNFFLYNANAKTFSIENERLQLWFAGLSLSWDLWNWGYTSAKSSQAEEEVLQSKESLELLKDQIELEVYNAFLKLHSEKQKTDVGKLSMESAEENLRLTKEKYDYNLATSNDLIDAEVELLDAKTKLAFANAEYELAKVKLELAVGNKIY